MGKHWVQEQSSHILYISCRKGSKTPLTIPQLLLSFKNKSSYTWHTEFVVTGPLSTVPVL
ncbi:hypothetical protein I79_017472 [Cricetulus griseus]|uniref:Uncharacterized protein n=1 Tax=Cricetulus griseus TaxID=10029 RepID=G3I236_CRIGR|nr:hypothetical protein I79_017472 [Cricetulus griseus]